MHFQAAISRFHLQLVGLMSASFIGTGLLIHMGILPLQNYIVIDHQYKLDTILNTTLILQTTSALHAFNEIVFARQTMLHAWF